jgi:hypothetical protein
MVSCVLYPTIFAKNVIRHTTHITHLNVFILPRQYIIFIFSTRAMLLLIDCKYKILGKQPHYQKLVSTPDEKPLKQSNGHALDIQDKTLKVKFKISLPPRPL